MASAKKGYQGRSKKGYRGEKHVVLGMQQRDGELRFVHLREKKNFEGIKATIRANILAGERKYPCLTLKSTVSSLFSGVHSNSHWGYR